MVKTICKEESDKIYMERDMDFSYDHYDSEVRTIYVREAPDTTNEVTFDSLKQISIRIKEEIDDRWQLGILHENTEMMHNEESDEKGMEAFKSKKYI